MGVGIKNLYSWTPSPPPFEVNGSEAEQKFSALLDERAKFVDPSASEIGLYPAVEALILDGIVGSKRTDTLVMPQKSLAPPTLESVDFSIQIMKSVVSYPYGDCLLYMI